MKARYILGIIFALFGIFLPVSIASAEETPATFPETVQSLTLEEIDTLKAQVMAVGFPLAFNEETGQWSFVGIAEAVVRYDMRTIVVDLVRVRFPGNDSSQTVSPTGTVSPQPPGTVWVVVGVQRWEPDAIYIGSWPTAKAAYNAIQLGETVLEVHFDGNPSGADLWNCTSMICQINERLTGGGFEISDKFIHSGGVAPSWYSWGFIFWKISPQSEDISTPHHSDQFKTIDCCVSPGEYMPFECIEGTVY
jgi:hypothetical protein